MFNEIEKVLEKEVRPFLAKHYGDVQLIDVKDGVIKIKLTGQCKNCPSAKYTVEDTIESALKRNIEQIKEVVLVNEVSEEILDMARRLLGRKDR